MTVEVALSDVAIEQRKSYRVVYDQALRGDLGQVVRKGGRLFILREEVSLSSGEATPPPAAA